MSPPQHKGRSNPFVCCDFRDYASVEGLKPQSVTLILTNPPLGKRVPIPNLRELIEDLFAVAATVLKTGGKTGPGQSLPPNDLSSTFLAAAIPAGRRFRRLRLLHGKIRQKSDCPGFLKIGPKSSAGQFQCARSAPTPTPQGGMAEQKSLCAPGAKAIRLRNFIVIVRLGIAEMSVEMSRPFVQHDRYR